MKTLFVHYSLEGNCRQLAELMATETNAVVEELRLTNGNPPPSFFKRYYQGGKGSLLKETPPPAAPLRQGRRLRTGDYRHPGLVLEHDPGSAELSHLHRLHR